VEVVPMEELESVLESSSKGTVVTSRYFLQPVEAIAQRHGVRAVPVDLNDFRHELDLLKELRQGSCVGLVSISPGILRAAEVILHSMRGNELLVMTANPDIGSRLLALLRASSHVLCDRPSLPLVEQTLRQNRAQLMRLPVVHCAQSYLGTATIDQLRKEIGLLAG
jgi:GntR family transcriptional regulator